MQTSYISAETGDSTAEAKFPVAKKIHYVAIPDWGGRRGSSRERAIVAFGSSLTDGDGTDSDSNGRWPDVLAKRLQKSANGKAEVGVLNEGIIGNRLLNDSPAQAAGGRFGAVLGQAGLTRFERDVLHQSGVRYVIVGLGINDIAMPGSLTPASEGISAESIIAGYRQLIARGPSNREFESSGRRTHRSKTRFWIWRRRSLRSLSTLPRKKACDRRSTHGSSAALNSMAWSISTRSYATRVTPRNCFPLTTAETTCIPTMRAASPREMLFRSRCSKAVRRMPSIGEQFERTLPVGSALVQRRSSNGIRYCHFDEEFT